MNRVVVLLGLMLAVLAGAAVPLAMGGVPRIPIPQPTRVASEGPKPAPTAPKAPPTAVSRDVPAATGPRLPAATPVPAPSSAPVALPDPTLAPLADPSTECAFVLGFAALRDLVGRQVVGSCLEDQWFDAEGNAQQQTTEGTLHWRKADNWMAFTDGDRTWVNGPNGVQEQPGVERPSTESGAGAAPP